MESEKEIVYAKIDQSGCILEVINSTYLPDHTGWIEIDAGSCADDRFRHAQSHYFKELTDARGIPLYAYAPENCPAWRERTQEEIYADYVDPEPVPSETEILRTQVNELQAQLDTLLGVR